MAAGTNVGSVYFNLEISNTNQIQRVVQQSLGNIQAQVNNLSAQVNNTTAQAVQSTQTVDRGLGSLAKTVGLVTVAVVALRKAFNFGGNAISLASDLQEVQNVVDVTYGAMSEQVNEFAKNAMESFGIGETAAKKYMGTYGAMAKAFGYTTQDAYKMSEALTSLTGDVASFYNYTTDEAYTKLKSVFTGETESLKDMGVVMTQAALDSYALANGFGKTTKEMSEQEKVLLRYSFVMDSLAAAQGDYIRTSDNWANQIRTLNGNFNTLKTTIGEGLIIALTPVVRLLNQIIEKLTVAAQAFTGFIKGFFGIKDVDTGASGFVESMTDASLGAQDMADGTEETAKNLAKAKKQLMGFDKLYKLADTSVGSGAGGSGGTGIGDYDIKGYKENPGNASTFTMPSLAEIGAKGSEFVVAMLKALSDKIRSVDWNAVGVQIGDFLKAVEWTAIGMGVAEVVYEAISAAFKVWGGMFSAAPIETAIITAIALLKFTGLGSVLMGVLSKAIVKALGADSGTTLGAALAAWLGKGFTKAKGFFVGLGPKISTWVTSAFTSIKGAFVAIGTKIGAWISSALVSIKGFIASIGTFISQFGAVLGGVAAVFGGTLTAALSFFDMLANGFSWVKEALMLLGIAIAAVGAVILGAPALVAGIVAAIVAVVANLVIAIVQHWETIKTSFVTGWEMIIRWTKNALTSIGQAIVSIWNTVKTWVSNMVTGISNMMSQIGNAIRSGWDSVANWFTGKLNAFKTGFVNIFTGIKDSVVRIIDTLATAMKTPVNRMIDMLNRMIEGLNKLDINIPDWVPGMGGKSLGFNIPKIPKLAMGGYVKANNPQLAIIGDNRREGEIVAPESKITEAVNNALIPFVNQLVGALRGSQTAMAGGGDIVIPVYIGNDLIDQYIVNAQTKNTFRSGR